MVGFCERDDVRLALQKRSLDSNAGDGPLDPDIVDAAIEGASTWFANATNGHWYDSGDALSAPASSATATASDVQLDVPSSPHAQDRRHISDKRGTHYPVTVNGPYAEMRLPHYHVTSLSKLEVRDIGGGTTDWVAESSKTEGKGDDYYITSRGQSSYGRSYLYLYARGVGARTNFDRLLTLKYDYGLDWASTEWQDVRRGIAALASAQVIDKDDVLTQLPDNGQIVGVQTQYDNLLATSKRYLDPYLSAMGDMK